jgi:hypothetical protein
MKLKRFYIAKETVTRLNRQPTDWKKLFSSYISDRGLITRKYRKLRKLTSQRINPLNKWENELNRQFLKGVQMVNKYLKKCSMPLAIKDMQLKIALKLHLTPVR